MIYTSPNARRLGYSKILLNYLIEVHPTLLLLVKKGTFVQEYYKKLGFSYLKTIGPYILMGSSSKLNYSQMIYEFNNEGRNK